MKKYYIRYVLTDLYEIQMSLIVAQESLYEIKYNYVKLRNFFTYLTVIFFKGKYKIFIGYSRYWMLHSKATLYRGLTCFKKFYRHYSI